MPRISRGYFPNQKSSDLSSSFYPSILIRDVHTGIVPYRSSRDPSFKVKLARRNQSLEGKLKDFFYVGQYSSWNFTETITDAIETLAHYLAIFGDVYLEIADAGDEHKKGVTDKTLEFLPRGLVFKFFNKYLQIVPIRNWKPKEKKFYIIPSERIWHLKMPRELGTPRQHRRLLGRLKRLSETMPEFTRKDEDLGGSAKYDFVLHHDKKELAVELLTRKWGSIPSLRQIKHTTEYYYIVHRLQFLRSQALMREHICREFNEVLKQCGVNNMVIIEGLVLSSDIEDVINKLNKGEVGFGKALEMAKS